jgi:hypothetical protein
LKNPAQPSPKSQLNRIRLMIGIFVVLLVLSGVTAFPLYSELKWVHEQQLFSPETAPGNWLETVWMGIRFMHDHYPFMIYGYDWLAFAHLVIAMAFIGPWRDPVRNVWIIEWAMLACVAVLPLAFFAGPIRGIPWYHILVDCSFGIFGLIPLWITRRWIRKLATYTVHSPIKATI